MTSEDTDQSFACFGIDVEADDAEAIARKLGVEYPGREKTYTLTQSALRYVNRFKDGNGNTILMNLAGLGKPDCVDFLSRCECVDLETENNESETAALIAWNKKEYTCLLRLLQNDSKFPYDIDYVELDKEVKEGRIPGAKDLLEFVRTRESLHECIKNGDLEGVKKATKSHDSSFYYYYGGVENKSALGVAAALFKGGRERVRKANLDICVFLMYVGCTYGSDEERVKFNRVQKKQLKALRNEYFTEGKDSHLVKLISSVKVFGEFTDDMRKVVGDMFESLNRSKAIKVVMKTIANEHVDVVFHFASDQTDLLHDENAWGLADHDLRRVYIAAKSCLPYKRIVDRKVAGTLAHELCHIAMQILYQNDAKPYGKGDERKSSFDVIVEEIKKIIEQSPSDDSDYRSVIERVFRGGYAEESQHAEMIVRVVHLLAMYGDVRGKEIIKSFSEPLLSYFEDRVIPDCKRYYKGVFYRKPLTRYWNRYREFVHAIEEGTVRLKASTELPKMHSYKKLLVLVTSSVQMSCIHVYQFLEETYSFHFDKCCLFIELSHFVNQYENIIAAFNSKACKYLVLKPKDKELENDLDDISIYLQDVLFEENKKVILIVDSECNHLPPDFKENVVKYVWDDLSESSKEYLMRRKVNFQGIDMELDNLVDEKLASNIFHMEELSCLIDDKTVTIGKDKDMWSPEFYISRFFVGETFDELICKRRGESCILFVTGISDQMLQDKGVSREELHLIEGLDSVVELEDGNNPVFEGKGILIPKSEVFSDDVFKDIVRKNKKQIPLIWLHYLSGHFYLKKILHSSSTIEQISKKKIFSEDDLIEISDQNENHVMLISDDAGTGKSTVMTEIIRKLKKKRQSSWVIRFDFNEYADDSENPLSLKHIGEDKSTPDDIINHFIVMIGLENRLEVALFKAYLKLPSKVSIMFDGFDEISTYYRKNAFSLFRDLKECTKACIWITTRSHDREMLETHFNTFSYRLDIIALPLQADFLNKFWKKNMKCPKFDNSKEGNVEAKLEIQAKLEEILRQVNDSKNLHEKLKNSKSVETMIAAIEEISSSNEGLEILRTRIDNLDLTDYARVLLLEMDIDCVEYENQFTVSPLHLFMMANVSYHENLKVGMFSDIFDLYSKFLNKKLEIFAKEKCRNVQDTQGNKNQFKILKEQYVEEHQKMAVFVIQPDNFEWKTLEFKQSVLEFIHDIGILYKTEDGHQFVHRSFAEYFFSDWLCKVIKSNNLEVELLEEILREHRYGVIMRFLSCRFEGTDEVIKFNDTMLEEMNIKDTFLEFLEYYIDDDMKATAPIWKNVFEYMVKNCDDEHITEIFFESCLNMDNYFREDKRKVIVFQMLKDCLSVELLLRFLDVLNEDGDTRIIPWIIVGSYGIVSGMMEMIKKIADAEPHRGEAFRILLQTDELGYTLLHRAAGNQDPGVFRVVMSCMKHVLGEDLFMEQLTKRNQFNATFINCCIIRDRGKTIAAILQDLRSIFEPQLYMDLLKEEDSYGNNVLRLAISRSTGEVFDAIASNLIDIFGYDVFLQMLVERNKEKNTMLHSSAQSCDVDIFSQVLLIARSYMNDKEFQEFVMSQNERKDTILHVQASQEFSNCTFSFLQTLKSYIGKEKFAKLALMTNNSGDTFGHTFAKNNIDCNIDSMLKYLDDLLPNSLLRKLFQMKNNDGDTILEILQEKGHSSACIIVLKILGT